MAVTTLPAGVCACGAHLDAAQLAVRVEDALCGRWADSIHRDVIPTLNTLSSAALRDLADADLGLTPAVDVVFTRREQDGD